MEDWGPPEDVSPQPATVASWSVNREDGEAGRHTGAAAEEKFSGVASVMMEKSKSAMEWL